MNAPSAPSRWEQEEHLFSRHAPRRGRSFEVRVRADRPRFWRGMVFDAYDGRGWTRTSPDPEPRFGLPVSYEPQWSDAALGGRLPGTRGDRVVQTYELLGDTPRFCVLWSESEWWSAEPGTPEAAGTKSTIDVFCITLALMVGTAGLPHVIVRFYTVRSVRAARWSTTAFSAKLRSSRMLPGHGYCSSIVRASGVSPSTRFLNSPLYFAR